MKRILFSPLLFLFLCTYCAAQEKPYRDSLQAYRDQYVRDHEVVKGKDKNFFRFFPIDETFRVPARFEKIEEAPWFKMETSGKEKQVYRVYGILRFSIHDTLLHLDVYQSQRLMGSREFAEYLFIPFTDKTSGEESYENGRYIDLVTGDLGASTLLIDFNKAYNPYCAYISNQYNCPIPPKENNLDVAIRSGEMKFGKSH